MIHLAKCSLWSTESSGSFLALFAGSAERRLYSQDYSLSPLAAGAGSAVDQPACVCWLAGCPSVLQPLATRVPALACMCYRVSNPRYELFCQNRRSPGTTQSVRRLARGRLGFGPAALAPPKDRGLPGARPYVRDLATSRSIRAGAKCPPRRPRGEATLVVCYNRQGGGKGEESKLQQQNSAKRPASLLLVHHGSVGPGEHARERRLERERPVLARRPA